VIPEGWGVRSTIGSMFAVVWHFWIAVVLVITAVIPATVMIFAQYLRKTQAPKYGRDE
jgi:hypothetical protein